jgi:hypothetical protein
MRPRRWRSLVVQVRSVGDFRQFDLRGFQNLGGLHLKEAYRVVTVAYVDGDPIRIAHLMLEQRKSHARRTSSSEPVLTTREFVDVARCLGRFRETTCI